MKNILGNVKLRMEIIRQSLDSDQQDLCEKKWE